MAKSAGYSTRTLAQKLGYKAGQRVSLINAPQHYIDILGPLPADVDVSSSLRPQSDIVHCFCRSNSELETAWSDLKSAINKNGSLWISWPKKSSPMAGDISEDTIRGAALAGGLVDVKVCAVDADWSGLKLMYRRVDR